MIDEMNKRIIDLMVRLDLNKASFARELDVSLPLMTHITSGRNKPGLELLQRILTRFEDINPDWLLLGKGEMYREKAKQKDFTPFIAQINKLLEELDAIKQSQISVIQYHKILFDEIMHLAEIDVLIEKDGNKLADIVGKLEAMKVQLQSE